jgi:hypothetical protein
VAVDVDVSAGRWRWERGTPYQGLDVAQLPSRLAVPVDPLCSTAPAPLACASEEPP